MVNAQLKIVIQLHGDADTVAVEEDQASNLERQASLPLPSGLRHFLGLPPTVTVDAGTEAACLKAAKTVVKSSLPGYYDIESTAKIQAHVWKNERWQPAGGGEFGFAFAITTYDAEHGTYSPSLDSTIRVQQSDGTDPQMQVHYLLAVQSVT